MAANHPSNHNVPEAISFIVLLNELQRRSMKTGIPAGFHAERDLLWEELVEREHSLEQKILLQLELCYEQKQSFWQKLYQALMLKMNRFASAFQANAIFDDAADSKREHQI